MFYDELFADCYALVRPIVLRLRGRYSLKLWERDDWEQEGMIVLYDLLCQVPDLANDAMRLRIYFKTKFSNHINDELRKQESQKRQFNRLAYEDISTVSHLVPCQEMMLDDYVVFMDSLERAKGQLKQEEAAQIDLLTTGRAFKGRTKLVRRLQVLMAS